MNSAEIDSAEVDVGSGKYRGLSVSVPGAGKVQLMDLVAQNAETAIYRTSSPGIVVKMFDLDCGKADEVSYGPYLGYTLEQSNFQDILAIPELRPLVPAYYGSDLDYASKYAFIAMEFLHGGDLKTWCLEAAENGYDEDWITQFKQAIHESMAIMRRFHQHGILLVDYKPENIIRLGTGGIRMVDLGAFLTPRHYGAMDKYVYSATPDYAELLIDASNIQGGLPPTEASDIFSAGVALFEMATGNARLEIASGTAQEILERPSIYKFRDSQIRDIWRQYPHLMGLLPTVETQLREHQVLFSEIWHLLKAYLSEKVPNWESIGATEHEQILLATGTTFILEQLPERLQWLAGAIAQATVIRSIRLKSMAEFMRLVESPVGDEVQLDLRDGNSFFDYLCDRDSPSGCKIPLNTWDVCWHEKNAHWAISAAAAGRLMQGGADFLFLNRFDSNEHGHRFYKISDELRADRWEGQPLALAHLRDDHGAWLGP